MLTLTDPWGLLALAGVPLIVALHLFRRRFHPRPVSALFLWGITAEHAGGGRIRQPLRNRASLWWEILVCVALAIALAQPRLITTSATRHLMLVMDTRWSMSARVGGSSAWDRALAGARQRLAGLEADARVTVIATGRTPRLVAGPAATALAAESALAALRADQPDHDPQAALNLAASLGGPGASVLLLSDQVPTAPLRGMGWSAVGIAAPTSGFAEVQWLDDRHGPRIVARVVAHGAPVRRSWTLNDGDRVLAQGEVEVAPDHPALITIPATTIMADTLTMRLLGDDPLPGDDACRLRRPPARQLTARVDLPTGTTQQAVVAALRAAGVVTIQEDVTSRMNTAIAVRESGSPEVQKSHETTPTASPVTSGPPDFRTSGPSGQSAHLLIHAGPATEPVAERWTMSIRPGTGPVQLGPFLMRSGHPLLDGVDSTALVWAGASDQAGSDESPLLSGAGRVLIGEIRHGAEREIVVHLDPQRARWFQHPSWPAFIANCCALRRRALPGPERTTVLVNEPVAVRLPAGVAALSLIAPDQVAVTLPADADHSVVIPGLDRIGTWTLRAAATTWLVEVVALDAHLADLSAATTVDQEPQPDEVHDQRPIDEAFARILPLLVAAAALVLAWRAARREGALEGARS